ncbi:MAG TPA: HAMP domain-containing protein, partial [Firmicutes bacterium]|nr:HAMP domain-containing protein [Bacillota bacterium]
MKLLLAPVEKVSSPSLRASFENSMEIARRLASQFELDAALAVKRLHDALLTNGDNPGSGSFSQEVTNSGADFWCLYVRDEAGWKLALSQPDSSMRIDSVLTQDIEASQSPQPLQLSDPDLVASSLSIGQDSMLVAGLALEPGLTSRMRKTGDDLSLYASAGEWVTTMRLYITIILSMIVAAAARSATLLSRTLARRISSPIKALANATRHLAAGDFDHQVNVRAKDEIGLLIDSFNNMAQQLKANREHIIAMTRHQAQIERDFEIARQVQSNLFPKTLPTKPSWDFAATCLPARAVGGDYYDVFEIMPDEILIAQGDVSGKGLGASLVMASIHAMVRSLSQKLGSNPASVVVEINRYLVESSSPETFVTLFIGLIDCRRG